MATKRNGTPSPRLLCAINLPCGVMMYEQSLSWHTIWRPVSLGKHKRDRMGASFEGMS